MSTATVTPELDPPQDPSSGHGPWLVARATSNLRRWLARFHPVGLAGALLFYCWSLSPSLPPARGTCRE